MEKLLDIYYFQHMYIVFQLTISLLEELQLANTLWPISFMRPYKKRDSERCMFIVQLLLWPHQRYTYRVLQTIQMKLILLCVWAEWAVLGSAKTALKFKNEI